MHGATVLLQRWTRGALWGPDWNRWLPSGDRVYVRWL